MAIRVAINGFGRIGRNVLRAIAESGRKDIEVVGINDLGPVETNAHLLRYDSVHGRYPHEVTTGENWFDAGRGKVRVTAERDPAKLPWKELLARFILSQQRNDYTWMKPNKRYIEDGIYLPVLHSEGVGKLVVAVDTSGSIGQEELNKFLGELNGILDQSRPESAVLIPCDAAVDAEFVRTYAPEDYPITSPKLGGGGGTDFTPVFDYVKEQNIDPVCLIYLTDMMGTFPEAPPPYPTLWIATSEIQGPFGQTVRLN